eukprot:6212880-Pleurochrysis_carterae.AAC.1
MGQLDELAVLSSMRAAVGACLDPLGRRPWTPILHTGSGRPKLSRSTKIVYVESRLREGRNAST